MNVSKGDCCKGRLDDRVAIVTGGASGLGKSIAQRLASEGAAVVITDIQSDLGHATAAEYGFTFIEQDVREESRWTYVVNEAERIFGRVNILVNNAGIPGAVSAADPETARLEDWRMVFAVNVEGVFLGCRAVIPAMRRSGHGSIVNLSSIAGICPSPQLVAYGASKSAVEHLTKSVATYCIEQQLNVRCNSVHPGNVLTPLWKRYAQVAAQARGVDVNEIIAEGRAASPSGEFVPPEDVAAAVCFLVSDESRCITGDRLVVDGGYVCSGAYRHRTHHVQQTTER